MRKDIRELFAKYPGRDYIEDYRFENGNYECLCFECKKPFIGHKRRIICKECSDRNNLSRMG